MTISMAIFIVNRLKTFEFICTGVTKKGVQPFFLLAFRLGYRQVTCILTSIEQSTPYERELSVCLLSVCEYWRYSIEREQELKAQYVLYVHFKFVEWSAFVVNVYAMCLNTAVLS